MRGSRWLPGVVCGGIFVGVSAAYAAWFLIQRPNLSFAASHNAELGSDRSIQARPDRSVGQTFTWHGPENLGGLAVQYVPGSGSETALLHATLTQDGRTLQTFEGERREFVQARPWIFTEAGEEAAVLAYRHWLFFVFDPPLGSDARYTLTLEPSAPIALPFEIDSSSYADGERIAADVAQAGDLSFVLLATTGTRERLQRLLAVEPHGAMALLLLAGAALAGLAVQMVQRVRAGSSLLPEMPLLLWLLAAVLFTLPLYYTTRLWGGEDWPEVTAHYAAARQSLAAGQFPLWNPYFCGGFPLWGNPQTYWPSLSFLLALLAGDAAGTKLAVTLYLFLGLCGTTLLGKTLGLRYPATLVPPIIYLCSGFFAFHISAGHWLWLTAAWVPFMLHFFWRGLHEERWRPLVLSVCFFLLMLLEGQLYFFIYSALLLAGLGAAAWLSGGASRPQILRRLVVFGVLTLALGAVKLLPTWAFVQQTDGVLGNTPALLLRQLPALFLAEPAAVADVAAPLPWWEVLAYTGMWPLAAAAAGVLAGGRQHRTIRLFFLAAGLLALGVVFLPAPYNPLEYLPLTHQLRSHNRALLIVILSIALLAGFGCQRLRRYLPQRTYEAVIVAGALLLFLDFSRVAHDPLAAAFASPVLHSDAPAVFAMRSSQADSAYHLVLAGAGAPDYCPPHLRQWGAATNILTESDTGYRGEAYSEGGIPAALRTFSPNRLLLAVGDVPEGGDSIHFNQKYDGGWFSPGHTVTSHDGLLTVEVSPTDSGKELALYYRPRSFTAGAAISGLTALLLIGGGLRAWKRR